MHRRFQKPKTHQIQDVNFWEVAFEGVSGFLGFLGNLGLKFLAKNGPNLAHFEPKTQTHPQIGLFLGSSFSNLVRIFGRHSAFWVLAEPKNIFFGSVEFFDTGGWSRGGLGREDLRPLLSFLKNWRFFKKT